MGQWYARRRGIFRFPRASGPVKLLGGTRFARASLMSASRRPSCRPSRGPSRRFELPSGEELPKLLVDEVRDYAIVVVDPENRIRMWNRGARLILGYRQKEVLGQSASIFFTPEDRAAGEPEKELRTAARAGRAEDERWHVRKNGQRFWGSGVMSALRDSRGRAIAFVKLMRDHTQKKKLEDQIRAVNELLERRVSERTTELIQQQHRLRALALETVNAEQRARDALAADLHDNLAQLLAASLMKLGVAAGAFSSGEAPPAFAEGIECVREVLQQVRQMMYDLSPMTLGDGQLVAALDWVRERMKRHGLEVVIQDASRARRVNEDVIRVVYRAVHELLWNVVKHAQVNRATVKLARVPHKERLRVQVIDRGRGFNPARSARGTRASGSGGFGLFSLRERLIALGGTMDVRSAKGKGTTVTIEVPVGAERRRTE
jgi:PAS domain S-box-containing protein